ncbi:ATP-dependent bile acid permease [Aspergillus awamori]|uniref:ATP-dependent bile acid permease n=1 Tax=Aspergillus awamori TaxID=105351 RepID=A0A401KKX4_ASPAW|nr:ATP-dependent bile acid permease [Aspergillus awamori]
MQSLECAGWCTQIVCFPNLVLVASCLLSLAVLTAAVFRYLLRGKLGHPLPPDVVGQGREQPVDARQPHWACITEGLGLVTDIGLGAYFLVQYPKDECSLAAAPMISSVYLFLLVLMSGREHSGLQHLPLKGHAVCLYLLQWWYTVYVLWLAWIEDSQIFIAATILYRLMVFTVLVGLRIWQRPAHLARLTFHWVNSLVWKSFWRTLEAADMPPLPHRHTTARVLQWFQARVSHSATAPLLRRILQAFAWRLLHQGAWATVLSVVVYVPPLLIRKIIQTLQQELSSTEEPGPTQKLALSYVGGLLLFGAVAAVADCQCNWIGCELSADLRVVLVDLIHRKILRTPIGRSGEVGAHDEGRIMNLLTVDSEQVSNMAANVYLVWVVFPVQMVLGTYLLYLLLGISGLLGVLCMVLLLPLNVWVSRRVMAAQGQVLVASDARLQASSEILSNIHAIKYGAWETALRGRALQQRTAELQRMRIRYRWWSISQTLFFTLPFLVTIITCLFYTVVFKHALVTEVAFPALAIFTALRIPLNRLADSVTFLLQAHVSLCRISGFLDAPETERDAQLAGSNTMSRIGFIEASFCWPANTIDSAQSELRLAQDGDGEEIEEQGEAIPLMETNNNPSFSLNHLNIEFHQGVLNVISGPSGSGKSAILLALLGELHLLRGRVSLPAVAERERPPASTAVAYCPQQPWIRNTSIRENILLGSSFDATRYHAAIAAVALEPDLRTLEKGDATLAGEQGARLSGGQKQRVALARAMYSRAQYVLVDDGLSALDAHTAHRVLRRGLLGTLMRERTCVLVTHNMRLVAPYTEHVVLLEGGMIAGQGSVSDLVQKGLPGIEVLQRQREVEADPEIATLAKLPERNASHSLTQQAEFSRVWSDEEANVNPGPNSHTAEYSEHKGEGAVSWPVILSFVGFMGAYPYWMLVLVGFVGQQAVALATSLWFQSWAHADDSTTTTGVKSLTPGYHLSIYGGLCVLYALITLGRDLVVFSGALRASTTMYQRLVDSILGAELAFFDRTPLGQMINRFSKDVEVVDQSLIGFSISFTQLAFSLLGVVILITAVLPVFVLFVLLIGLVYGLVTALYLRGARDLKRIEALQRSPIYQLVGDTIRGRICLRAGAHTVHFTEQVHRQFDILTQATLLLGASKEWLALRIGILSAGVTSLAGLLLVYRRQTLHPGAAGLVLTAAASTTETVMWIVQIYAILQQNLTSLDRIVEYTLTIPQEEPYPVEPLQLPDYPQGSNRGAVVITDYTARYGPTLPPSIKGVTLSIPPGTFWGILGRTGSGKSTLARALIRAGLEVDCLDRNSLIQLDGVNIAALPLSILRKAITVIPQDPTLFAGSLRDNLSPDSAVAPPDNVALKALQAVGLISSLADGLGGRTGSDSIETGNTLLDQPADTLSRGQRQLLCIARGLLHHSRVLVLDEATASVDREAEKAVRRVLRALASQGITIVMIAHRLVSVAECDFLAVMEAGKVVEVGRKDDLLQMVQGRFKQLVDEAGEWAAVLEGASS